MARVNDNHFLTIEGWMRSRLGLSGNELIVYAVVYQFSQGNAGRYIGGLPFLADWCGCHIDTARRAVRNLEEQGLILPLRGEVNGVPYCNYIINEASLQNTGIPPQNAGDTPANYGGDTRKMQGITINKLEDKYNTRQDNIRFTPPSLEEVRAYCLSRANGINPESFIDYYTANGWKVGRNPMRDWRAAVRQWEQRRKEETPNPRPFPRQQTPRQQEGVFAAAERVIDEINRKYQNLQQYDEQ